MEISKNVQDLGLLSELAYLKLEHEYFSDKDYSKENIERFLELKVYGPDDELLNHGIDPSSASLLKLLDEYTIDKFITEPSGMQAMVLIKNDGSGITVSYRGTETGDWVNAVIGDNETTKDLFTADKEMALGSEIQQMTDALSFMKDVESEYNDLAPITITGHSLGGALAQYVAYKSETKYETYTFNGFGIRKGEGIIGTDDDTSHIHNFHSGIDFISGVGSVIGGFPGGEYLDDQPIYEFLPKNWYVKLIEYVYTANVLLTTAQINAKVDEYMGSFLGETINIMQYDNESFLDYGTDHGMTGVNDSLNLYFDLGDIFNSTDIQSINYDVAQLAAVSFDSILDDSNGLPKALELIGYSLLGKTLTDGTRYDTLSNTQTVISEIKSLASDNSGLTVFYSENETADMLLESAKSSKAIMYTLINNLAPVILNNPEYELYQDLDISYMSDEQLDDKALMYYHLITHKNTTIDDKIDFIDYSNNTTASSTTTNDININSTFAHKP